MRALALALLLGGGLLKPETYTLVIMGYEGKVLVAVPVSGPMRCHAGADVLEGQPGFGECLAKALREYGEILRENNPLRCVGEPPNVYCTPKRPVP